MSLEDSRPHSIRDFILDRYRKFRSETFPARRILFDKLSQGQEPRVLFITCSDSRVAPSMILSGDPGDIFECRIVGNIVPPYGDAIGGVSATLEYAVTFLKVQAIIVCGHSDCGAMKAIRNSEQYDHLRSISSWLHYADAAKRIFQRSSEGLDEDASLALLARENVIAQIDNMRTHPAVAEGRRNGFGNFRLDVRYRLGTNRDLR